MAVKAEKVLKLEDGSFLIRDYGKYSSNLTILSPTSSIDWIEDNGLGEKMNTDFDGETSYILGSFFVSKKGTECFRISKNNPKHILIKVIWMKEFHKITKGLQGETPEETIYYRRAKSNGGQVGNDYIVLPVDYKQKITLDDI